MMTSRAKQGGFTIVELLIVIVVIAILAAITILAYNGIQKRAQDTQMFSDLASAAKKLELYNAENGSYPTSTSQAVTTQIKFSFSPVGNNVLLCSDDTGFALFSLQNSTQYKIVKGQSPQIVSPQLSWSSSTLCNSTPYPSRSWGNFFVVGG